MISPPKAAAEASRKRYFLGTHRTRTPEETWERVTPFFPRVGITRIADVTWLDCLGIPVYQAVRPGSRNISVSQGKGLTPAAARVGAAMESIEVWHAECLDHVPSVAVSLQEMRYGNPIRQRHLPYLSGTRFLQPTRIAWVKAKSLSSGRTGWLPRGMIELDFSVPDLFEPEMFSRNSTGLASGNELDEALLHGVCEVIERHGSYLAEEDPKRAVPLDEDSIESDPLRRFVEQIRAAGFKLALYDITWEVGVPAAMAHLVAPDLPVAWYGAGAHCAAEVAVSRALTEAAQSRLTYIAGARDDLVHMTKGATCHRVFDEYVEPTHRRPIAALPDLATSTVSDDLGRVVDRLQALGLEPFWVDLTHPEIGIPVVSTFVPGLKLHD